MSIRIGLRRIPPTEKIMKGIGPRTCRCPGPVQRSPRIPHRFGAVPVGRGVANDVVNRSVYSAA